MVNNSIMDYNSKVPLCLVCSAPGTKRCSGCHIANYCSIVHQKEHWKIHKKCCCPYEIRVSEELGRHFVASRDLPEGSIIIKETPFAFAPYDVDEGKGHPKLQIESVNNSNININTKNSGNSEEKTDPDLSSSSSSASDSDSNSNAGSDFSPPSIPICLSCCIQMTQNPNSRCEKCKWPICSTQCQEMSCHSDLECSLFSSKKIQFPPKGKSHTGAVYGSILILRLILLKEKSPGGWRKFLEMEHHNKIRASVSKIRKDQERLIKNLAQLFTSEEELFQRIGKEELVEIIERVNINSFGVARQEEHAAKRGGGKTFGRGIFLKTGIVSHGCIPNAVWGLSYSPNFEMILRSSVPIKKGEIIQHSYNDQWNFLGTYQRQLSTFDGSQFSCKCSRCSDPTEYGTLLSAIKCFHCSSGYFLPENPIDLNAEANWICTNIQDCGMKEEQEKIMSTLHYFEVETEKVMAQLAQPKRKSKIESKLETESETDSGVGSGSCSGSGENEKIPSVEFSCREKFAQLHQHYIRTCQTPSHSPQLHPHHFLVRCIQREIINQAFPILTQLSYEELNLFIFHCEQLLQVSTILSPGFNRHLANLRNYLCQGMLRKKRKAHKDGRTGEIFQNATTLIEFLAKLDRLQKQVIAYYEKDPDTTPPPPPNGTNNQGPSSLVKALLADNAIIVRDIKVNMSSLFK